jgi:hypothetical protein
MQSPAGPFEQFRTLMEADWSLREQLCQPDDPALFIALVVERARPRPSCRRRTRGSRDPGQSADLRRRDGG